MPYQRKRLRLRTVAKRARRRERAPRSHRRSHLRKPKWTKMSLKKKTSRTASHTHSHHKLFLPCKRFGYSPQSLCLVLTKRSFIQRLPKFIWLRLSREQDTLQSTNTTEISCWPTTWRFDSSSTSTQQQQRLTWFVRSFFLIGGEQRIHHFHQVTQP